MRPVCAINVGKGRCVAHMDDAELGVHLMAHFQDPGNLIYVLTRIMRAGQVQKQAAQKREKLKAMAAHA